MTAIFQWNMEDMTQNNRLKNLLVALSGDDEMPGPVLDYGLGLARAYQSRVTVCVFAPVLLQPFPLTLGSSSIWIAQETDRIETRSGQIAQVVQQRARELGVPIDVEHAHSPFDGRYSRFIALARLHDLTVLQAPDPSDSSRARTAIEHALFDSGRPVLITPDDKFETPRRVMIAWDGSAEAARAVRDGLDLFLGADHVAIATVIDTKGSEGLRSADELVTYLSRYGIGSEISVIAAVPGEDEGFPIRQFVTDQQVDLLVMGAFVHSRLRQAILGGMTRSLLENCPVPILMSH
ncbi:universal stress protein [Aquamicrobium segne]|uniref:Universal stress protein n=1 Tax=Aquamicrobium segne TaxID=469547 RepID=A0ABW0H1W8_9HYPH